MILIMMEIRLTSCLVRYIGVILSGCKLMPIIAQQRMQTQHSTLRKHGARLGSPEMTLYSNDKLTITLLDLLILTP